MAHFLQKDVLIVCSCGSLRSISKLYFCRYCIVLRCGYCVSHEIDSIYCSNCLENLASSEAKLKKNRCGSCFECPFCFHALSVRATVTKVNATGSNESNPSPPTKTTKSYYLACFSCRWTSRDVKIPDQQTATSSNWPERENPNYTRINTLIDYYKAVALRERLEKEKKMYLPRRGYQHFSEKFGLTAMIARKRAGLPQLSFGREDFSSLPELTPAVATEEVDPLPADIFSKLVDVTNITTLRQRYVIPDLQPDTIDQLFPVHKHLFCKRSERCRSCLHNVFKPEYSPGSIKFKIYLAAYSHVPEVRLMKKETFKTGEQTDILIKLINPAQTATNVQLLPVNSLDADIEYLSERKETPKTTDQEPDKMYMPSIDQKRPVLLENPRSVKIKLSGSVALPSGSINLLRRDDAAEYDDNNESGSFHDDPKAVIWRKANKVIIRLTVTANDDLANGNEVVVAFKLRYVYKDKMISTIEQKEGKDINVDIKHVINVGTLVNDAEL